MLTLAQHSYSNVDKKSQPFKFINLDVAEFLARTKKGI